MKRLRTEKEIMKNWKGDIENPLVSICCITYNHEPYIRDALEGFLIQETDFPFEILIHDDASPDKTASIIKEYYRKYPKLIKPIFQNENQYSKGIKVNLKYNFLRAKGEYIAVCEGDDYWSDKKKLAKQVKFLEENKSFIGSAHNVLIIDENKVMVPDKLHPYKRFSSYVYTINDAKKLKLPSQLASLVYRNFWRNIDNKIIKLYSECNANGDLKLALLLALQGNVYCFSENMAYHRKVVSHGTSWSAKNYRKNLSFILYRSLIELTEFSRKAFGVSLDNKKERLNIASSSLLRLMITPSKENLQIITKIFAVNYDRKVEIIFYGIFRIVSWPFQKIKKKLGSSSIR